MTATEKIGTISSDLDRFTDRAAALGVTVSRVAGSAEAAESINAQLAEAGAARVLISTEITAVAPGLVTALEAVGCAWDHPGSPPAPTISPLA